MRTRIWLNWWAPVLALAAGTVAASVGRADFVVVPNNRATMEGNLDNGFPFNISAFGLASERYQQVYAASQFASLGGPELITQLTFRPDGFVGSAFSSTIANIQIDLSTTTASVNGLSMTFANNVGANNTVVFSGALSLSSSNSGPAGGPKDFDIVINLLTPFLYDPSAGNLLLDVRNFSGGFTTQFDAEIDSGVMSRVATFTNGDVNSPTADFADGLGLVTRFTFEEVPEPGTLSLLSAGGLGLLGYGWRRWKRVT